MFRSDHKDNIKGNEGYQLRGSYGSYRPRPNWRLACDCPRPPSQEKINVSIGLMLRSRLNESIYTSVKDLYLDVVFQTQGSPIRRGL